MNLLSLFDGISCARVALDRAGIPVKTYFASEIDKNAIKVSQARYPDIVRLGDVRTIHTIDAHIDLLIGGSPCVDLSIAKRDRKGLEGERSSLFWEYKRLLDHCKPTWFILENVASMSKADKDTITRALGVEPVMFDASLVSAQSRKRLFWTNIKFDLPEDKNILLKDILQPPAEVDESMVVKGKAFCLTATYAKVSVSEKQVQNSVERKQRTLVRTGLNQVGYVGPINSQTNRVYSPDGKAPTQCKGANGGAFPTLIKMGHFGNTDSQGSRVYSPEGKSVTLSANGGGGGAKTGMYCFDGFVRKLTPVECERLQGLPDNYTEGIAKTNRYKCLGNAFNVDVVTHILRVPSLKSSC